MYVPCRGWGRMGEFPAPHHPASPAQWVTVALLGLDPYWRAMNGGKPGPGGQPWEAGTSA